MTKENNPNFILGLDISSSAIGIVVLDLNGAIHHCFAIDFKNKKKFPTLFSKAEHFENYLKSLMLVFPNSIKKIVIESPLKMFRPGQSSAHTISTLISFNGIISWILYKFMGIYPEYVSASTARKNCGIKVPKGENTKKFVLNFLQKSDPIFSKHIEYSRLGSISTLSYDKSDAYVIAKSILLTS